MERSMRHAGEILEYLKSQLKTTKGCTTADDKHHPCLKEFPDQPDSWCLYCTAVWLSRVTDVPVVDVEELEIRLDDRSVIMLSTALRAGRLHMTSEPLIELDVIQEGLDRMALRGIRARRARLVRHIEQGGA